MNKVGFGGGCHWCTEAVFQQLVGVSKVQQGWIASIDEDKEYSEAVIVHYESDTIDLHQLVHIHLHTHSCTSQHAFRKKYRSAIYYFSQDEVAFIQESISKAQVAFAEAIITKVIPFSSFKENIERYQNYHVKNKDGQFCRNYIVPKLKKLEKDFGDCVLTKP